MEEHVSISPVTLETVDASVKAWFDLTVAARVQAGDGDLRPVPVIFSVGERFNSAKNRRGVRDRNGVIMLPLISIRRTGIEPQATMAALGVETPDIVISRRVDGKTNVVQNANAARPSSQRFDPRGAVYEVTTIPFPDFSITNYELVVQTQYMTQMNAILEKVFHSLDLQKSFVMPIDNSGRHVPDGEPFEDRKPSAGGYFVGFLEQTASAQDNFEEFTDQERIVQWSTSFRVPTYLQLDPDGKKPMVRRQYTAFGLDFTDENMCWVDSAEDMEIIFRSSDPIAAYQEIQRKRGIR